MSAVRMIARPMLASMFVVGGLDSVRRPGPKVPVAEDVARPVADAIPIGLPDDTEQLVRINGAVQVGAGVLLAIGKLPRLAALTLAASLVPTTAAGHPFWEAEDDETRAQQLVHFTKNVSMLGGLLIAAADTGGRPSVTWAARRATKRTGARAEKVRAEAQRTAERSRQAAEKLAARQAKKTAKVRKKVKA